MRCLLVLQLVVLSLLTLLGVARGETSIEGFTEPIRRIDLAAAEPGILVKLFVKEGESITIGQPLARLDREVHEISAKIAKRAKEQRGRLSAAQAELKQRAQRLERLRTIEPKRFASADEIARAETELSIAEANLLAAEEQIAIDTLEHEKARAILERRELRSPIDGVVIKLHREEREFVSVINPTVVTVVQLHPLQVIFPVPTTTALKLAKEQQVSLRVPELKQDAVGRIEMISPITEAESGTVRVKVLIDNAQGQYRAGMRCVLNPGQPTSAPLASVN
ncbi:MAG: efflux RND transporter periplasmic adaptor subunit [Planctomycetaceae bacterium]|nr:efflux RND transporter periplasmic adaptor subunit [Planctomycetaceae bacterium]